MGVMRRALRLGWKPDPNPQKGSPCGPRGKGQADGYARAACLLAGLLVALMVGAPAAVSAAASAPSAPTTDQAGLDGLVAPLHYLLLLPADGDAATRGDATPEPAGAPGRLRVVELVQLRNPGSEPATVAVLPLFSGAAALEPITGFAGVGFEVSPQALRAAVTIPPGATHTFSFSYELALPPLPTSLTRAIVHPTERLLVLLPHDAPWEPLGAGLSEAGIDRFADREVRVYRADSLTPTMEWVLGLRELGAPSPVAGADVPVIDHAVTDHRGLWRLLLVTGAALLAALLIQAVRAGWRGRADSVGVTIPVWFEDATSLSAAERQQAGEALIDAAVRLEEARAAGRLSEAAYREAWRRLVLAYKHLFWRGPVTRDDGEEETA